MPLVIEAAAGWLAEKVLSWSFSLWKTAVADQKEG